MIIYIKNYFRRKYSKENGWICLKNNLKNELVIKKYIWFFWCLNLKLQIWIKNGCAKINLDDLKILIKR